MFCSCTHLYRGCDRCCRARSLQQCPSHHTSPTHTLATKCSVQVSSCSAAGQPTMLFWVSLWLPACLLLMHTSLGGCLCWRCPKGSDDRSGHSHCTPHRCNYDVVWICRQLTCF
jgi:hypothetical protein